MIFTHWKIKLVKPLTLFSSKHPSVLRDNGKTYPFRVASPKGLPGQKDRKVKLKGESILLKKI